jgi:hypothetical protein
MNAIDSQRCGVSYFTKRTKYPNSKCVTYSLSPFLSPYGSTQGSFTSQTLVYTSSQSVMDLLGDTVAGETGMKINSDHGGDVRVFQGVQFLILKRAAQAPGEDLDLDLAPSQVDLSQADLFLTQRGQDPLRTLSRVDQSLDLLPAQNLGQLHVQNLGQLHIQSQLDQIPAMHRAGLGT